MPYVVEGYRLWDKVLYKGQECFVSGRRASGSFALRKVAPYRDRQGRLVLDDIHDLPEVVEKVFAGHPEFTHTFFHEGN